MAASKLKHGKYYKILERFNKLKCSFGMKFHPEVAANHEQDRIEIRTKPFFHVQVSNNGHIIYFTPQVKSLEEGCKQILLFCAKRCGCKTIEELELKMAIEFGV